jgi:cob(I)alamin adenosyltransferase
MSIATKQGDTGMTRLMYGERVSKADLQVEAYGTIDELNAFLGMARSLCDDEWINRVLERLQRETFVVGAELATPPEQLYKLKTRVDSAMIAALDNEVQEVEAMPNVLGDWALPGATQVGAAIDVARVVCRRAERCVVRLSDNGALSNSEVLRYLNRLSDVLWLLGRRYEIAHDVNGALRPEVAARKSNSE